MRKSKEALRKEYRAKRSAFPKTSCSSGSAVICEHIGALPEVKAAQRIFAYLAVGREPHLASWITKAWQEGKAIYVPRCTETFGIMEAVRIYPDTVFSKGAFQIREPMGPAETALPEEIDCVLVPGVVFDEIGGRIGMGAGYYDRFLQGYSRERCIGIAWDFQVQPEPIPMEPTDHAMGMIVTEKRIIRT